MQKPDEPQPTSASPQASTPLPVKAEAPKETPQPSSNAPKPDKTTKVPKYVQCLASDTTIDEKAIHAVMPDKNDE